MEKELDVYRDWLGIAEKARPLNCYQLLRLKDFEDNAGLIRNHYRKMNAHVRKYATGDFSAQSQQLLNELAKAMLCLTDAQRKREYDASLGRKDVAEGRRRSFEEVLLANKVLDREKLDKARSFAQAVGLEMRDAILQQKLAEPEGVMLAFAESMGLSYLDLEDVGVDPELAAKIPATLARQRFCVPVMSDGSQVLMATPNPLIPDVEEELRLRFGVPVRTVLCTPVGINQALAKYYPKEGPQIVPAPVAKKLAAMTAEAAPASEPQVLTQDDQVRRRFMIAVMAACMSVTLAMVVQIFLAGRYFSYMRAAFFAVLFGMIVGGISFVVVTKLRI
jgi:hypothetical protein